MTYKYNNQNTADGLDLLKCVHAESIKTVIYDPQYRGVLDKLKYGNEGQARGKARCELTQMDEDTIIAFIKEIDRVLKNSGHLFLWVDKFHLCQGIQKWIDSTSLQIVDMIVWDKDRIGMGYRTRRKAEYLLVLQKPPIRAKGCWKLHNIPDVWREKVVKIHPHSKPVLLQAALIEATTSAGDIIVDPAAGGYSVLSAVERVGDRLFLGCDIGEGGNAGCTKKPKSRTKSA